MEEIQSYLTAAQKAFKKLLLQRRKKADGALSAGKNGEIGLCSRGGGREVWLGLEDKTGEKKDFSAKGQEKKPALLPAADL